ncbi:metallophosphoesterase [Gloeothece citriformis PCC 7424]|uniref:Metallophosphoesterase n=1 Tax=Gloeothece citriformis (strain PCC 7424) TaxID=65393 RepID=B7K717_GLOC7|nr:metallophosphoesterase [Gloeothece citriformis]ACK72716.1 metallophosphoesterase [Gloeothece citriformis PCC 7424]
MSYNRRQFLLVTGSLCGLAVATIAHQALTRTQNTSKNPLISSSPVASPVASPKPSPAPSGLIGSPRGDVRIVVISDLNSQYGSTTYEPEVDRAIALLPDWEPDLVLCGGDMIAGQKTSLTRSQIEAMWAAFDDHVAQPLRDAGIPFGFTIGNHDGSGALAQGKLTFLSERELAQAYWTNPKHTPGLQFIDRSGFPFYYTFTQKDVFYLVWDASTHLIPPEQLTWVEKSLSSQTAQQAKMRIVIGHLPLYTVAVGRDKFGEFLANGEQLRSLLERYQVHTYVSGHHHAYYPGKKGQLELLHAGALGGGPRKLLNSNLPPTKTLTVVDIDLNSESTRYTTYDMKTLSLINIETLPRMIDTPNGRIFRRDVTEP